eukprot:11968747-Prorocentrum_lima.AAC.1
MQGARQGRDELVQRGDSVLRPVGSDVRSVGKQSLLMPKTSFPSTMQRFRILRITLQDAAGELHGVVILAHPQQSLRRVVQGMHRVVHH